MLRLNRERAFRTGSAPMENCRRRQSSSTSVLLPTGSSGNGMTVQQELVPGRESCGRDIRITFTIQDTSLGPLKRGLGDDDFFNCSTVSYSRSVSIQLDDNLALLRNFSPQAPMKA